MQMTLSWVVKAVFCEFTRHILPGEPWLRPVGTLCEFPSILSGTFSRCFSPQLFCHIPPSRPSAGHDIRPDGAATHDDAAARHDAPGAADCHDAPDYPGR